MRIFASLVIALTLASCDDDSTPADQGSTADLSATAGKDMACDNTQPASSQCGHKCDKGNSKGIGQYCDQDVSCPSGLICSALFQPNTNFCTAPCTPDASNMDVAKCGENTLCQCAGPGCGCTPNSCVQPPQG